VLSINPLAFTHPPITLACALLKKDNFELAIQKATEIGIARFLPITAEHSIKTGFHRERLEKIIREAVEQSGRAMLPTLHDPLKLSDAIKMGTGQSLFFTEDAPHIVPKDISRDAITMLGSGLIEAALVTRFLIDG